MNALALENVSARPWGDELLQDISLQLPAGDIVGIIGPNGAGKSSLLQAITGEFQISGGHIDILGKAAADWEPGIRAQSMAVLPQLSLLNFPYTVEEVVMLGRTPHSSGYVADRAIVQQVMAATDTSRISDRIYTQLSGGEKQRVQLARVFAQVWAEETPAPRLLLLDEPTTALDLAHQQLIMHTLRELAETGCGIVIVAHDFNLVAAIADQVCALHQGKQHSYGSPDAVLCPTVFREVFQVEISVGTHPDTGKPRVFSL
jgi:iron complex transport system ATP-binding protein